MEAWYSVEIIANGHSTRCFIFCDKQYVESMKDSPNIYVKKVEGFRGGYLDQLWEETKT